METLQQYLDRWVTNPPPGTQPLFHAKHPKWWYKLWEWKPALLIAALLLPLYFFDHGLLVSLPLVIALGA